MNVNMNLNKFRLNKKAGFTDLFIFIIVAFALVLISGMFIYMSGLTQDKLHETMDPMSTEAVNNTAIIDDTFGDVVTTFSALRWISWFLIIGMAISIFIGSYLVTTRPVFMVPYILITAIAIIVSVGVSNAYHALLTNAVLGATYQSFVVSSHIMKYLPMWVTIIGFIGAIIMFSRMGSREERLY